MVVGGDDEEPGAEVEGDDHAPQVPPRRDASHGADGGHHVEHLEERKKAVRSSCDFLLHLPRLDLAVLSGVICNVTRESDREMIRKGTILTAIAGVTLRGEEPS